MIDWFYVFANTLWILGLAVILASLSLTHWLANLQGQSFRRALTEPRVRLVNAVGFVMFTMALTLLVGPWWYKIGWIVVLALSIWEGYLAWRDWSAQLAS